MSDLISSTSIQKLEHEIPEIRIRTLKYIENKILYAVEQNNIINFNSTNLFKKLINWLYCKPLVEIDIVLNLILILLHTEYSRDIIKNLKINWLKLEFHKIYENLLEDAKNLTPENKQLLFNILAFLDQYKFADDEDDEDVIDLTSIKDDDFDMYSLDSNVDDEFSSDYELIWTTPSISDYKSIKLLANSLSSENSNDEIQHAFGYLKIAINDYPPEYFLQPPYIFKLIMKLKTNENTLEQLLENLSHLTKSIKKRIDSNKLSEYYIAPAQETKSSSSKLQISINRFCVEVFNLCLDCIKNSDENWNMNEQLYLSYSLIFSVLNLISDETTLTIPMKVILTDLGTLARFYRESYIRNEKENRLNRIQYMLIILLISKLLKLINLKKRSIKYNSTTLMLQEEFDEIWYTELKHALLDNTILEIYPTIYNEIKIALNIDSNLNKDLNLQILLNSKNILIPAVQLLKEPHKYSKKDFILIGKTAIDTLSIHKSLDLIKIIIKNISESLDKFEADENLKLKSENILLRLFAHENFIIKRLTYKECASIVKYFFGNLMNGKISPNLLNGHVMKTKSFGIPLTIEILNEIVCFGCNCVDPSIRANAEIIIVLILKGQYILSEYWNQILEILQPIFPVLQCLDASTDKLSSLVINLFNPDNSVLSNCEILKNNLRFLYHSNAEIRSEALSRIIYILSQDGMNDFLPNVLEIADTVPNNICILDVPRDISKIFSGSYYDRGAVIALLEILRNQEVEPNIRKTTFMQLNVICQNPELNELFFNENGWYSTIEALENSLKREYNIDYPDVAIPVIGIISKLLLHNSKFRLELSEEGSIYVLLIRALLLFHHDIALQQDCSLALFLLLFNSNIVGGANAISMPIIFSSKLKIPFKCINWHWESSPYTEISPLEQIWLSKLSEVDNNSTRRSINSSQSVGYMSKSTERLNDSKRLNESTFQSPQSQFIRLTFATEWFRNFNEILKCFRQSKSNSHSADAILDYSIFPPRINESIDNVIKIPETLKFNRCLELTEIDLKIIKHSLIAENVKLFLRRIINATTHNTIVNNISLIKLNLCLIPSEMETKLPSENILQTFRSYFIKQPVNEIELLLLNSVINLYINLVQTNAEKIISWTLEELKENNCIFLELLKNYELSHKFIENLCEFLKILLKKCINYLKNKNDNMLKLILDDNKNYNLFNKLFEQLIVITEECFHKRFLERVRSLLTLLEILSETKYTELDSGFIHIVSKKLLYFIMNLGSFYQAASHLNKNCLLIIGNLIMAVDEFLIDANHVKFLAGFSSHFDLEIRALTWSIFEKLSRNRKGAELLIRELVYLPGGFHSCCLTVFLNTHEAAIVRSVAGSIFSNLLTYTESNGNLLPTIVPICIEEEPSDDGLFVIKNLILKHQLFSHNSELLDKFYLSEIVPNNMTEEICTCSLIKTFCSILINYIDLNPEILINELEIEPVFLKIFNLIKQVTSAQIITRSSLEMNNEICNLIIRFLNFKSKFMEKNLSQDVTFITALFQLLNIEFYDDLDLMKLTINNLEVLKMLSNSSRAIEIYSEILSSQCFKNLFNLLNIGFNIKNTNTDFQNSCLKFFTSLLINNELYCTRNTFDVNKHQQFASISKIIDETNVLNIDNVDKFCNNRTPNSEHLQENSNMENTSFKYASEFLFLELHDLVVSVSFKKVTNFGDLKKKLLIFEAIAALLKSSDRARIIANKINFLTTILKGIRFILDQIKMNCSDFIRKYGDAKKDPIVKELEIHYSIIMHWYNGDCLTNEYEILEFSKLCLQTWPWIMHSDSFRRTCVKTLVFLSEDSLKVCKQFSSSITNYSNSVLQLIIKFVLSETSKIKHPQIDFNILKLGLRILSNCCSCIEGRNLINKADVLEVFDKFHPSLTKLQKVWNILTVLWLEFWEIFSRHEEGANQKYLVLLCNIIAKGNTAMRSISLTIIRNMAFLNNNRIGLLNSNDVMYIMNSVLLNGTDDEIILVTTTIWQLIADNYKAKFIIRGTAIPKNLKIVMQKFTKDTSTDLVQNVKIVLKILKT